MTTAKPGSGGPEPPVCEVEVCKVEEVLPQGLYRVSRQSGKLVLASLGGKARQTIVRVLKNDHVSVEISPYDPTRGKIISKA